MLSISDLQLSAALTRDYADIIMSRTVLKQVIKKLDLDLDYKQFDDLITVENPDSTHIIQIDVTCNDAELCRTNRWKPRGIYSYGSVSLWLVRCPSI